jgi:uncharacterized membrane protein
MPKRHTYVATCIKETPIRWGVELASLGDPVPPKVVRFPHLTQSLTQSPYFQSGCDPIAYLRQLVKGMPEMLRGYNARIIKQIQGQMDGLQVGDCCYVKVSYIDNGEGISPYNYNIELIDTPPSESHYNFSGAANRENTGLPSAAPSMDNLYAPYAEEIDSDLGEFRASRSEEPLGPPIYNEADPIELITQLHQEIRKLQTDLDLIKDWIAEAVVPACQSRPRRQQVGTNPEQAAVESTSGSKEGASDPLVKANDQRKEIPLNSDEQRAIQYVINQQMVTESQLRDVCRISNPIRVMDRLIEKMERSNFPWISAEANENGEFIYTWNAPDE